MGTTYTISELANEFDLTTRAIRFYEDRGLLQPARRGRTRVFDPRDRTRLRLIQRGKRLGFSLDEISQILDMYEADSGEAGQLSFFLDCIEERRQSLEQQRNDIEQTLIDLKDIETQCRSRLRKLNTDSTPVAGRRKL